MLRTLLSRKIQLVLGGIFIVGLTIMVIITILGGAPVMDAIENLNEKEVPSKVLIWLEEEKHTEAYGAFYYDGHIYLAGKMGERPTGGYGILLGGAEFIDDQVVIQVEFKNPKPWDMVTQVITYPRTVVKIHCPNEPAHAVFMTTSNSVIARVAVRNLEIE